MKNKPKKKGRFLIILLLVICIGVLIFSAYKIVGILSEWNTGTKSYNKVSEQFVTENEIEGEQPEINFTELQEEYSASVGWIRIEGTRVDYPVAQWTDNSYYLNHLLDGTRNNNGTVFMDYRNSKDLTDRNTFLYGHHMKNGSMFGSLVKYKKQDYYEEHPIIEYITPEKTWKAEVFSAQIVDANDDLFTLSYDDDEDFAAYLREMQKDSLIRTNVEVSAGDRILTLMTCTYEYDNARFVVQAKLVEEE